GRSAEARAPRPEELRGTLLLALPLDEASVKVRSGPPIDDEADLTLPVWAGVIPIEPTAGAPLAAPGTAGSPPARVGAGVAPAPARDSSARAVETTHQGTHETPHGTYVIS